MPLNRLLFCIVLLWSAPLVAQDKNPPLTQPPATDSMVYYNNTKKPAISNPTVVEYAPTIQADGKTIIYEAQSGKTFNLFQTQLSNGKWGDPSPITRINSSGDSLDLIGGPSISFDGNELYFFRTVGIKANPEIFYSRRGKEGWSEPENMGFPINSDFYEGFPSISADGSTLYFVRQNFEGPQSKEFKKVEQFCLSIYKSVRDQNGKWSNPEKTSMAD